MGFNYQHYGVLKVLRTNSFGMFLKSMVERLGVTGQNTIATMITLFQYPVDVIVNVAACMVMPTEMGKHLFVDLRKRKGPVCRPYIRTQPFGSKGLEPGERKLPGAMEEVRLNERCLALY
jgi:hypothetical protein